MYILYTYIYMMQPSLVPLNGYGYTGAMFPALPPVDGWGAVVVVVSRSELQLLVGMGMGIQELCSPPPPGGGLGGGGVFCIFFFCVLLFIFV
jgi:hypothetical protein